MHLSDVLPDNTRVGAITLCHMTDNFGNPQDNAPQQPTSDSYGQSSYTQGSPAQNPENPEPSPYAPQQQYGQSAPSTQPYYSQGGEQYQQQSSQTANDPRYANQNPYAPKPQQPYVQQSYSQQAFPQQPYYVPNQAYGVSQNAPWNVMAIVGFALCFVFAPAGLVISIIALVQIHKSRERGNGLAIAGTVVGGIFTIIIAIFVGLLIWGIGLAASSDYDYYSDPSCSSSSGYGCYSDESDTIDSALRTYIESPNSQLK